MKIRKQKQRNKHLNDMLLLKPAGRHEPKLGNKASRAKQKHSQNKEDNNG